MATDFFGSNVQTDGVQTLYLMNPSYSGYGNPCSSSTMPPMSTTMGSLGHTSPLCNPGQQHPQQQFMEYSLPSPQSHLATLPNTNMGYQNIAADLLANRSSTHGYSWGGGNEFSFLPSSGVGEANHSLMTRIGSLNTGQQHASDMSQFGVGGLSHPSYQDHAPLMSNGVARLNMDGLQSSTGAGQILSLSLSSQKPSIMQLQSLQQSDSAITNCQRGDTTLSKEDLFSNTSLGGQNLSMIGSGFLNHLNSASSNRLTNVVTRPSTVGSYGSRYLQAAQELLNEVVSVGRGITSGQSKHTKVQSWVGPNSSNETLFTHKKSPSDVASKDPEHLSDMENAKDRDPAMAVLTSGTGGVSSDGKPVELTPAESQELQTKKAKLIAMRDEVDRRYKQYYHQMQIVVASFESAAGFGAARTYTALALQTISKHFRCLRDAITGQVQATSNTLGEEDVSGQGISRLRFVDQQLRQQRTLRQLGMMQQHAWRPQRGLPEHSVSILRAWLFEHFLHPYPKDADKILLARQTGLTRNQVSNWFINARVRLWKPMVEEMYLEEVRDPDGEGAFRAGQDVDMSKGAAGPIGDEVAGNGTKRVNDGESEEFVEDGFDDRSDMQAHGGCSSESHMFLENGRRRQGAKMARTGMQDSSPLSAEVGSFSAGVDATFKLEESHAVEDKGQGQGHAMRFGSEGYGSFQINGLGAFSQELALQHHAPNSGVSLTLGLQHCEALPGAHAPSHYEVQPQLLLPLDRQQDQSDYYTPPEANYFQNQKHFLTHILRHDFAT